MIRTAFPVRAVCGESFESQIINTDPGIPTVQPGCLAFPLIAAACAPIAPVYAAQQDNWRTSRVKVWAHNFRPSTMVKYGNS